MFDEEHALMVKIALPVCTQYGLALAGGYAVKAHGLTSRPSDDVDFATASSTSAEVIICALAAAYQDAGFEVEVLQGDDRKGHLYVNFPGGRQRVDLLKEPLRFPPVMMSFGPVVALGDSIAMKMSALADRGLPRDVIDVYAAKDLFGEAELVAMARAMLGDDFDLATLRDQLDRAATFEDASFERYGCDETLILAMRTWAQDWATRLGMEIAQDEPWTDEDDDE
jgi:Nucleotidyl transferase AbiEii toxin, Type IV TA system